MRESQMGLSPLSEGIPRDGKPAQALVQQPGDHMAGPFRKWQVSKTLFSRFGFVPS